MRNRHPELLIPASSLEVLKTAVMFGADAVYIGGEAFGLRAKAKNFSMEDMKEGVQFAHEHGARVHVTVNILAHNDDLEGAAEYLKELKRDRTGCADHCRSGSLHDCKGGLPGDRKTCQHTGQQHELRHISVLVESRSQPRSDSQRAFA